MSLGWEGRRLVKTSNLLLKNKTTAPVSPGQRNRITLELLKPPQIKIASLLPASFRRRIERSKQRRKGRGTQTSRIGEVGIARDRAW